MHMSEHCLTYHGGSFGIQKRGRREPLKRKFIRKFENIEIEVILLSGMSKRGRGEPAK